MKHKFNKNNNSAAIFGFNTQQHSLNDLADFDVYENGYPNDDDFNFGIKDLYPGQREADQAYIDIMTEKFREMITMAVQHQHATVSGYIIMAHLIGGDK